MHGHNPEMIGPRQPVETMLALMLKHGRVCVGEDLEPQEVCFAHARPQQVSELERIFRAPVHFGCPRNEMVLDRALLDRPQRDADQRLLQLLDRQLGAALSERPERRRFQDVVMRSMADELPQGEPVVAVIAEKLRMSGRTLQRRLRHEGTSFSEVLSELRRDRALHYLRERRLSIGEVAFLLGFLDVTAFHRAFKRWTGTTPAQYRRVAAGGGALLTT